MEEIEASLFGEILMIEFGQYQSIWNSQHFQDQFVEFFSFQKIELLN